MPGIRPVAVGDVVLGDGRLALIAGPCVLEEPERVLRIALGLARACDEAGLRWVFKSSFDKANRTRLDSPRGPGLDAGLALLARVKHELGVPVTTDVHAPEQAAAVAEVADLLQVPAFLCRQTDLLVACGATGRPVNVKKGQFADPRAMGHAVEKVRSGGDGGVLLTERGTTFGHGDVVVDYRGLVWMRELGVPVVLDVTHASGGHPELAPARARAGAAVGVDAIFAEVHDDPPRAASDATSQVALDRLPTLLKGVTNIR